MHVVSGKHLYNQTLCGIDKKFVYVCSCRVLDAILIGHVDVCWKNLYLIVFLLLDGLICDALEWNRFRLNH